MWGSFSKVAVAQGLAGYQSAGGEWLLLYHLGSWRFYLVGFSFGVPPRPLRLLNCLYLNPQVFGFFLAFALLIPFPILLEGEWATCQLAVSLPHAQSLWLCSSKAVKDCAAGTGLLLKQVMQKHSWCVAERENKHWREKRSASPGKPCCLWIWSLPNVPCSRLLTLSHPLFVSFQSQHLKL